MRGDRPLSAMGFMSPQFKALAASQDLIGWREFTEGHISTHFYAIQSFHLAMSSSYLNGEDWTKQFISKLLQITHSQWIFRNFSLHDRTHGYLRNKKADKILQLINKLSDIAPEEIPDDCRFLLEINFSELMKSHIKNQTYWTLAMDAAIKAKTLELARRARAKQMRLQLNTKICQQNKARHHGSRATNLQGRHAPDIITVRRGTSQRHSPDNTRPFCQTTTSPGIYYGKHEL